MSVPLDGLLLEVVHLLNLLALDLDLLPEPRVIVLGHVSLRHRVSVLLAQALDLSQETRHPRMPVGETKKLI